VNSKSGNHIVGQKIFDTPKIFFAFLFCETYLRPVSKNKFQIFTFVLKAQAVRLTS
jgi:hypothetical protein